MSENIEDMIALHNKAKRELTIAEEATKKSLDLLKSAVSGLPKELKKRLGFTGKLSSLKKEGIDAAKEAIQEEIDGLVAQRDKKTKRLSKVMEGLKDD